MMNKHFTICMCRIVLAVFVCLAGVTNAFAQDQIATLLHDNELSVYYGADAFIEAYTIAESGDIITLSGGTFNGCNIDKAITIHGAGPVYDSISMTDPTKFAGTMYFSGGSETEHLVVEGVRFKSALYYNNLSYAEFKKCYLTNFNSGSNGSANNVRFVNCYLDFYFDSATNIVILNSIAYVYHFNDQVTEKNLIAYNSFVSLFRSSSGNYSNNRPKHCDFTNCIVRNLSDNNIPTNTCTFNNCICITNGHGSLMQYALHFNCIEVENQDQVFCSSCDLGTQYNPCILLDEIANSIVGTDGTQVGIHGGLCPWTDRPNHMIMRRCTVGNRTTDDGHLSVDIEVVTEE